MQLESKAQLSNILKKSGFSAAKLGPSGKVRGSRPYSQGGYEIELTEGPGGKSAFIRVVNSARSHNGKIPTLAQIKSILENVGLNVKETNWMGGGLNVK